MQTKFDLLVYVGLVVFLIMVAVSAYVIKTTDEEGNLETRKLRVAAVMLTGILALFVFTSILYLVDPQGAGKEIFDRAFTAMFTLAGAVVGYMFGNTKPA